MKNLGVQLVNVTADLAPAPSSSVDTSQGVNGVRLFERERYEKLVRGELLKSEVGESPSSFESFSAVLDDVEGSWQARLQQVDPVAVGLAANSAGAIVMAVSGGLYRSGDSGQTWTYYTPFSTPVTALSYWTSSSLFVVGTSASAGQIYASSDGISWSNFVTDLVSPVTYLGEPLADDPTPLDPFINDPGVFVMGESDNRILFAYNGFSSFNGPWDPFDGAPANRRINDVCTVQGVGDYFLLVCGEDGWMGRGYGGGSWPAWGTIATVGTGSLSALKRFGSTYVVAGKAGQIYYNQNPVDFLPVEWTKAPEVSFGDVTCLCSNGSWLVAGYSNGDVSYSADGTVWTLIGKPNGTSSVKSIAFDPKSGRFLVANLSSSSVAILSEDFSSWSLVNFTTGTTTTIVKDLPFANTVAVAGNYLATPYKSVKVATSVDESTYAREFATPPSWTQRGVGLGHSAVLSTLSSSQHEVSRLNAYASGTPGLESSPVPASGTSFYSKSQKLVYSVYKLSASADIPFNPIIPERFPSTAENGVARPFYVAVSGNYRNNSYFNPAVFEIEVPEYGKIRDIRVWVELIHDIRGGTGALTSSAGATAAYTQQGLQSLQIALRSPNVRFSNAHPLWNSKSVQSFLKNPDNSITGSSNQYGSLYQSTPELLRNSYLLWAGHSVEQDLGVSLGAQTGAFYAEWDTDIDMRTVFWDGSTLDNPRHIGRLYLQPNDNNPGVSQGTILTLTGSSPNAQANILGGYGLTPHVTGNNFPWMLDTRIGQGNFAGRTQTGITAAVGNSPPLGWLNGPGGTAAAGEFPTTGSQIGPANIQPMYPLLDDIFVKKIYDQPPSVANVFSLPAGRAQIVGFRPGLRGTEVHGKWQLLLGMRADFNPLTGMIAAPRNGVWFRQFRIEFILDKGQEPVSFNPASARKFKKSSYVPQKDGLRRIEIVSGSSEWDIGINYIYTAQYPDYGRTIGITSDTGSAPDFAVFTRVTGALGDMLTGSAFAGARYSFLNNEFGTPYIPISSGSGVPPSFQSFQLDNASLEQFNAARQIVSDALRSRATTGQDNTIRATLNRGGYVITVRDDIIKKLSGK